jgi:3alpha(or 20beta)-hydroxysteroid dehydrogenase
MGRLDEKVAIITGGARGMGASHAEAFVAAGAKVLITDVRADEGNALANRLGGNASFASHDVTSEEAWREVVGQAESTFGTVNVLVNNAGIADYGRLEKTDEAAYRRVIDINQLGVFLGMKAVAPALRQAGGGSIINISSVAGIIGLPLALAYTASKWAVRGMTKVAAKELGPDGIRVNSVHPGIIDTPMLTDHPGVGSALRDGAPAETALGRLGQASEVTNLVMYLASDDSSYSTGSEFICDGGYVR